MSAPPDLRGGVARLLAELLAGPSTYDELAQASGMAPSTVRLWIQALHKNRVVRVAAYERTTNGRSAKMVLELNLDGKKDARPAPKLTDAQRQEAYRRRYRERKMIQNTAGPLCPIPTPTPEQI